MVCVEGYKDLQLEKETGARMWVLWGLNYRDRRSPVEFIKRLMMDKVLAVRGRNGRRSSESQEDFLVETIIMVKAIEGRHALRWLQSQWTRRKRYMTGSNKKDWKGG